MYTPKPIDTTDIELPDDLNALVEQLAENTHDIWAIGRMDEGWIYGPERNDAQKRHPDLVPYAELTESEKAYDRNTVIGTLKAILALGYKIEKP